MATPTGSLSGHPRRRPTMGDVAERVGVSRQAVGLVFRNDRGISAETRERILQAADELGYQPDVAARSLRQATSKYLGVVFSPNHAAEVDIVDALYPAAAAGGYGVVLSALTSTRDASTAIGEVLGYRCAALLLVGLTVSDGELRRLAGKLPIVSIGGNEKGDTGCDYVRSAGDVGIGMAVQHLWELGHRDIAYVHGKHMSSAAVRYRGYTEAVRRLKLRRRTVVIANDYVEEAGARAAQMMLPEGNFPTAVVMANDHAAVGLIHSCLRAGVLVPEDLSVTGFDDSRISQLSYVDLTTIRQDGGEMAEAAVAAALSRIGGRRDPIESVIEPRLIIRGTTAAPRAAGKLIQRAMA
jgi:DNA-binding LacI/PurR family transcriptional regulator